MQNPKSLGGFISLTKLCELTGLHPTTCYRNSGKDGFPVIRRITAGQSGCYESEYLAWYASRTPISELKSSRAPAPRKKAGGGQ